MPFHDRVYYFNCVWLSKLITCSWVGICYRKRMSEKKLGKIGTFFQKDKKINATLMDKDSPPKTHHPSQFPN